MSDWSGNTLPGPSDVTLINSATIVTITHSTGTGTVTAVKVGADIFQMTDGSLSLSTGGGFANYLTVSGCNIAFGDNATVS